MHPASDVLGDLAAALVGRARRGDHLHDVVGHELGRRDDLIVRRRPREHLADLVEQRLGHARRLHDVGLLAEVLRHEQPGVVERPVAVVVERAHDELRPVDVVDRTSGACAAPIARCSMAVALYAGDTR